MPHLEVEKYRKRTLVLHWIHSTAFVILFFTGIIMFIPQLGLIADNSWIRVIHRIFGATFVIVPVVFLITNPKSAGKGLKRAFTWGIDDIGWLKAAPCYYLLGNEKSMPPQGYMNTGQKLWWLLTIIFGIALTVSGYTMWFGIATAPPYLLLQMIFIHDIAFIVTGIMFFVHIYIGVFHPLHTESWGAITRGKISAEYARTHHGKWYGEITGRAEIEGD